MTTKDEACSVLLRGRLSADGETITVAPGVEIAAKSTDLVVHERPGQETATVLLLYFHSDYDRRDFIATFENAYTPEGAQAVPA